VRDTLVWPPLRELAPPEAALARPPDGLRALAAAVASAAAIWVGLAFLLAAVVYPMGFWTGSTAIIVGGGFVLAGAAWVFAARPSSAQA
jgi:hypothetical protein